MRDLFPTGVPVRGKNLVGRSREIREILLLLESGQSIILIGPRRYGKTSLIFEVLDRLRRKGYPAADIDIFKVISKRDLAEKIVESVLTSRKPALRGILRKLKESIADALGRVEIKQAVSDFEFILRFAERKVSEEKLLEEALEFPENFARKGKKHLFFYYDEFGDIGKLGGESLLKRMRAIFQRHENVTYIFSGSNVSMMAEAFQNRRGAFYKFGRIINIEVVPKEALVKHIIARFSEVKIKVHQDVAEYIVDKTKAHPYYVQLICQEIYKLKMIEGKRKTCLADVDEAISSALISETVSFENMWLELSRYKNHLLILRQMVLGAGRAYEFEGLSKHSIYKALIHMKKTGYIKQLKEGVYGLIDPLFEEYLKSKWE